MDLIFDTLQLVTSAMAGSEVHQRASRPRTVSWHEFVYIYTLAARYRDWHKLHSTVQTFGKFSQIYFCTHLLLVCILTDLPDTELTHL